MDMSDGHDVAMGDIGMTEKSGTANAGHPNAKIPAATTPQEASVKLNAELQDQLDAYCPGDEQPAAMLMVEGQTFMPMGASNCVWPPGRNLWRCPSCRFGRQSTSAQQWW
jgi:hypothetical protein